MMMMMMMMMMKRGTHPMLFVNVLISVPLAREERVLLTDDLTVEKCHLEHKR